MVNNAVWKTFLIRIFGHPVLIRKIQTPVILRLLNVHSDETVLDAGCGQGFFTNELAKKSKLSVGIDLSLNNRFLYHKQQRVACIRGDIQKLPFGSEKFDKILLSSVLQVVKDDSLLFKECHRVLKPTGVLVASVPMDYCYFQSLNTLMSEIKNSFHVFEKLCYSFEEVTNLLKEEQFKILETEFSPKKLGSLLHELDLYLFVRFKTSLFSYALFPFFWLLARFDNFTTSQTGDEIVIKAQKSSN